MVHKYTQEQRAFIKQNTEGKTTAELTTIFNNRFGLNIKESQIRAYKKNHKLKSGLPPGFEKGKAPSKVYTEAHRKFIAENVRGRTTQELTDLINEVFNADFKSSQIRAYKKNHKLTSGVDTKYKRGQEPANKGKKYPGKVNATSFKKGNRPQNHMPVGSVRINGEGYTDVKVADPDKWVAKHILLWQEHHGPIPEGNVVLFGDGDRRNVVIDNLLTISKRQLLIMNKKKLITDHVETTKTGVIVADVFQKIYDANKRMKGS